MIKVSITKGSYVRVEVASGHHIDLPPNARGMNALVEILVADAARHTDKRVGTAASPTQYVTDAFLSGSHKITKVPPVTQRKDRTLVKIADGVYARRQREVITVEELLAFMDDDASEPSAGGLK